MTIQDAQRILSVGPPESTDEYRTTLRDALRAAQKAHHPDRNPQDPQGAEARFKEAQQAYQLLLDAATTTPEEDEVDGMVALLMAQNHALSAQNLVLSARVRTLNAQLDKATRRTQALEKTVRELRRSVLRSAAEASSASGRIRMAVRPEPASERIVGEWDPPDDLDVLVQTNLHSPK